MSLVLNDGSQPEVSLKTFPYFVKRGLQLHIKGHFADISDTDVFNLIRYYMTNTDLDGDDDIRHMIIDWMKGLEMTDGHNKDGKRFIYTGLND